jgi:hypothetical protein
MKDLWDKGKKRAELGHGLKAGLRRGWYRYLPDSLVTVVKGSENGPEAIVTAAICMSYV